MFEFISFLIAVFGILQIILFFKLWNMTNDVKQLREFFVTKVPSKDSNASEENDAVKDDANDTKKTEVDDSTLASYPIVYIGGGTKVVRLVRENEDGTCECISLDGKDSYVINESEIKR